MPIPDLSALLAPWPSVVVLIVSVRVEFEFIWTYKIHEQRRPKVIFVPIMSLHKITFMSNR